MALSQYAKAALNMDKHFHDWKATFEPKEALAFVKKCEVYNRITREGIVGLVEFINENAPRLDEV